MKIIKIIILIIVVGALVVAGLFATAVVSYKNTKTRQSGTTTKQMSRITRAQALEKVQALPDVREYGAMLAEQGKQASFNVEDGEEAWSVQVYEIVSLGEESHTATFNWYRVNKTTGAVEADF